MKAIEFKNISKSFSKLKANDDISFSIENNSVHCVLGENGAGKSTLMKILYGVYKQDGGEMFINGKTVNFRSPHDAISSGVAMVWQHFMLIDDFTVLENVILGNEPMKGLKIDFKTARSKIIDIIEKFNLDLKPNDKVQDLSIASQQKIELLKILYRNPEIIILDEPTAVLSPVEVNEFFNVVKRLKDDGKTIILITHKLKEVMQVADKVTVLRQGSVVFETEADELDLDILGQKIIGESTIDDIGESKTTIEPYTLVVFKNVKTIQSKLGKLNDLNLQISSGEIVGVCGVEGNGQNEIVDLLLGLKYAHKGDLNIDAKKISVVPDDRLKKGMISEYSIGENLIVRTKGIQTASVKKLNNMSKVIIKSYDIKTPGFSTPMGNLSGGNQQKAIVAREIENNSELIIFSHPTRGVDLKSSFFIHDEIVHARNSGRGVLLISSDLDELFKLSDRLVLIYNGKIVKEYSQEQIVNHNKGVQHLTTEIGKLMIGASVE